MVDLLLLMNQISCFPPPPPPFSVISADGSTESLLAFVSKEPNCVTCLEVRNCRKAHDEITLLEKGRSADGGWWTLLSSLGHDGTADEVPQGSKLGT